MQCLVYLAACRQWKEGLLGRENDRRNTSRYGRVVTGGYDELLKPFHIRKSGCHEGGQWKPMKVKKLDTITEAVATGINSVCESQI